MFANDRKTIGVFIFQPVGEFQNELCRGIIDHGKKQEYNILFFTSFGDYTHNTHFVQGERQILDLPPYEDLDGVILVLDTINIPGAKQEVIEKVKTRCRGPVVCIREEAEGFHNVVVDNKMSMEVMIRHFLDDHGFTKLCFMTGTKGNEDAEERLESFYRVMEEYNLEVDPSQVFYGDFWKNKGKEACDYFLRDGNIPEVIICANDYMAVTVSSELIDRGYSIPEDICVSGYDGLDEAFRFFPSITTLQIRFYDMGYEAISVLTRHMENKGEIENIFFPVKLVLGESCGCLNMKKEELIRRRRDYHEEIEKEVVRQMETTFMSVNLEDTKDLDKLGDVIGNYISNIDGYDKYFICLCSELGRKDVPYRNLETYTDQIRLQIAFDGKEKISCQPVFDKKELLPAEVLGKEPQIFFFTPLHYKERCFGYEAVSFKDSSNCGKLYLSWGVNIENAIQDILVQNEMNRLIDELEFMYVRDVLTGLYNRRGFEKYSLACWKRFEKKEVPFFYMTLDMDGLKIINDNYGHSEGDGALRIIAEALNYAAQDGEICARMGGDEYAVSAFGKSQEEVRSFCQRFEEYLEDYNRKVQKPYRVEASKGIYYGIPTEDMTLEECMKFSDNEMYKNKMLRKSKR